MGVASASCDCKPNRISRNSFISLNSETTLFAGHVFIGYWTASRVEEYEMRVRLRQLPATLCYKNEPKSDKLFFAFYDRVSFVLLLSLPTWLSFNMHFYWGAFQFVTPRGAFSLSVAVYGWSGSWLAAWSVFNCALINLHCWKRRRATAAAATASAAIAHAPILSPSLPCPCRGVPGAISL